MLTRLTGRVTVMTDPAHPTAHLIEVSQTDRAYTVRTSATTALHVLECANCTIMEVHVSIQHNEREGERMFGFTDTDERNTFNVLVAVPGVGTEKALALLSRFTTDQVWAADEKELAKAKGIGPVVAKTIATELAKLKTLTLKHP